MLTVRLLLTPFPSIYNTKDYENVGELFKFQQGHSLRGLKQYDVFEKILIMI